MKVNIGNTFICDNSSECEKDSYFLVTKSNKQYSEDALLKGSILIDEQKARELLNINNEIKIIGITGTNGKTTTAAAVYSILLDLKKSVFLCGTRGAFCNDKRVAEKTLTTGFLLELLYYLKIATENNCEYFIMEVSSHAIDQNRFGNMKFSCKIYTNLTQDHLDYHKTFEEYSKVKASFFQDDCLKIINNDALSFSYNIKSSITYGIDNPSLYSVKAYSLDKGINAIFSVAGKIYEIYSPLNGLFNIYNLLAAFACVNEMLPNNTGLIVDAISNFAGVVGRMQSIQHNDINRGEIIVDFAHTPDGVQNVLESLKHKKLIVVMGAGGNRDKSKRPIMTKIALHYASVLILTSDNPRDEEPNDIINDMIFDLNDIELDKVIIETNRKLAINKALELQKTHCVVILGKGDEDYQEIKGVKYPFSDVLVVEDFINKERN